MIPRVAAFAVLLTVLGYLLAELGWRGKRAFAALSCTALLLLLSDGISEVVSSIVGYCELTEVSEAARTALKVVFSGYVFGFCADTASELGESGIANAVTLAGRIEATVLVLPYLSDVLRAAMEVL